MGIKVNLRDTPDSTPGGAIALGKHPARLHVDAYQHDQLGQPLLDGAGKKVYWRSSGGDPQWKIKLEILDGAFKGRDIFDQLTFSAGGIKRIKVLLVRSGLATGGEDDFDTEPEDLDKSMWYITVDRHEAAQTAQGALKESKYTFRANGCTCEACRAYDGKNVNVNARIAFAGFELMDAETASRLSKVSNAKGSAANGSVPAQADANEDLPF